MLTNYLVDRLNEIASIQLYLPEDCEHYTSIVSFTHSDYRPNELADILDSDFDIAVRSGYHCAPYVHDLIGTRALGGTIRVSVGYFNTTNDIVYLYCGKTAGRDIPIVQRLICSLKLNK